MKYHSKKAFTLIEALIAISILMVALVSPLTIVKKALVTAALSQDQMTASFLAQDAIEAVKNIRDKTAINETTGDWLVGLESCMCTDTDANCGNFVTYCNIDTTIKDLSSGAVYASTSASVNPLKTETAVDGDGNLIFIRYNLSSGTDSKFSRQINIKKSSDNANEALIRTRVYWTSGIGVQRIDINNFIYNFSENL
ncbi:MAG: prepilin-type N-terminal cleavage/methylation domain-containing protein [archaeon]|jgi:type II secretory pathway pseudopilin PulG